MRSSTDQMAARVGDRDRDRDSGLFGLANGGSGYFFAPACVRRLVLATYMNPPPDSGRSRSGKRGILRQALPVA